MRAHQLDSSGVIVNTIMVETLTDFPNLVDASIGGQIGDKIVNGALVPASQPLDVPESISPRQFRQALNKYGFRTQVENAISGSADQNLKDWYAYASEFQRHHPEVLMMASSLKFTDAQLDQVWIYGATI